MDITGTPYSSMRSDIERMCRNDAHCNTTEELAREGDALELKAEVNRGVNEGEWWLSDDSGVVASQTSRASETPHTSIRS